MNTVLEITCRSFTSPPKTHKWGSPNVATIPHPHKLLLLVHCLQLNRLLPIKTTPAQNGNQPRQLACFFNSLPCPAAHNPRGVCIWCYHFPPFSFEFSWFFNMSYTMPPSPPWNSVPVRTIRIRAMISWPLLWLWKTTSWKWCGYVCSNTTFNFSGGTPSNNENLNFAFDKTEQKTSKYFE
jgi:hypothetical protein